MSRQGITSNRSLAVVLSFALLSCIASLFVVAFAETSRPANRASTVLRQYAYATDVAKAMVGASKPIAKDLIKEHNCRVCHVLGEGRVAPLFAGIADRAATRRPQLSPPQYIYESIVSPGAYLVDGYANIMPGNYAERLSQSEIGHIVAYLLALSDEVDA